MFIEQNFGFWYVLIAFLILARYMWVSKYRIGKSSYTVFDGKLDPAKRKTAIAFLLIHLLFGLAILILNQSGGANVFPSQFAFSYLLIWVGTWIITPLALGQHINSPAKNLYFVAAVLTLLLGSACLALRLMESKALVQYLDFGFFISAVLSAAIIIGLLGIRHPGESTL